MSEIIVGVLGFLGILVTWLLKKPEREREDVNSTVSNLRSDLTEAKNDARIAVKRSDDLTARLQSLEDRDRRKFQYELRHRAWDLAVLRVVREIQPNFPDPPGLSYFDETVDYHNGLEIVEGQSHDEK